MRASFGWIAFTLLLSLPAGAAPQRPDSTYHKALALALPALPPPSVVHYSSGYGARAAALQRGARAVHDLLRDSLSLEIPDITLLVLDSADWSEATELPYGLHTLLQDGPAFLAPAEVDRGIYHDAALSGREAELGVDIVGLHYLAHFFAAEALYQDGHAADPPVKWLDELFTLMLQDVLLAAADRELTEASWRSEAESLRLTRPRFTRLTDFDREYRRYFITPEGAPNYAWFLARLALWAREVRAEHGLGPLLRVRRALAETAPDLDTPAALAMLEAAGIATDRWRDGGDERGKGIP